MSTLPATLAARVRPQFPALTRTIDGRPIAYFDGPGGTQVPRRVVDAMSDYLQEPQRERWLGVSHERRNGTHPA